MIRRIGVAALLLLVSACFFSAAGQEALNPHGYYLWSSHDYQQDVSGQGYAMVYQYVNTNNLGLKNYMHGSGTIDSATLINSKMKELTKKEYYTTEDASQIEELKTYTNTITFTEQNEMVQSPEGFAYGTGYYAQHPIVYNSLLKERTDARSYQAGASMLHQIEYARGFRKDIGVILNCTDKGVGVDGVGKAQMRLDEGVIEGTVQIKEMLTQMDDEGKGSNGGAKKPLILIDEYYVGSFKIKKDMEINVPKSKVKDKAKNWLPCCFEGYAGMGEFEQRIFEKDIFDCTCSKAPTVAQFPRVYT
ncbi:MAG: hypothetical protein HPY61_03475 [Methanotrichaceae archaeon]|nr:hypothetical protein [Methanotrichaceae archaeon]